MLNIKTLARTREGAFMRFNEFTLRTSYEVRALVFRVIIENKTTFDVRVGKAEDVNTVCVGCESQ